jgi:hypothetical protein
MICAMRSFLLRLVLIGALGAAIAIGLIVHGVIEQDPGYHNFADQRGLLGLPHFFDVISNAPFMVVGLLGMYSGLTRIVAGPRRLYWMTFFAGVALVSLGSSYYHVEPNNETLVWDRLPMTIAFMALFNLVIDERLGQRAGKMLFPVLMGLGIASVLVWHLGEGDLRLYGFVQFFPLLAMPLLTWLFPTSIGAPGRTRLFALALLAYAAAKILEATDKQLFEALHLVSGHTLKHLAAGLATWLLYRMMLVEAGVAPGSKGDSRG